MSVPVRSVPNGAWSTKPVALVVTEASINFQLPTSLSEVCARGAERDLDGTAANPAGLLGRLAGLLPSRLLRLLLGLTGAGGERDGRERDSEDDYSREPHVLSFLFLLG